MISDANGKRGEEHWTYSYEGCDDEVAKTKSADNKSSTSSRSPGDVEGEPGAKKTRLVHKTIIYDESIANQWLDEPPLEVWDHKIILA